jgi:hypothetical protein
MGSPPKGCLLVRRSVVSNMAERPRMTTLSKTLRLACLNADEVNDRKLEEENFLK